LYSSLLANASFHELLLAFDRDLADSQRASACACGGALHSAKYPRKPRGLPQGLGTCLGREHIRRFSFCCAIDGCRSRATPPSLRFLGRKVYHAAIVVVAAIMWHGITEDRLRRLSGAITVDRRTLQRWQVWWRKAFTATSFWRRARAAFMPPVNEDRIPATLIERFAGSSGADRLIALLRFLGPITGGQVQAH
jgi:hypothetical protein